MNESRLDALVIGGGFYGSAIAVYLAQQRGFRNVLLAESEPRLLARASYHNQARVHNGYHYPRSFSTAFRSRVNLPKFVHAWPLAVKRDFTSLYAIARRRSKVTARQFERFCDEIGAKLKRADSALRSLFDPTLIEEVFIAEEYAFDAEVLAQRASRELTDAGVGVRLETRVTALRRSDCGGLVATLRENNGHERSMICRYVFNCCYSGLNQFRGDFHGTRVELKHEITELALMEPPSILKGLGITVMDGPFFSLMPFPARGLHSLSHVRYTPHFSWKDERDIDPYARLASYERSPRVDRMLRDVARYLPAIVNSTYVESQFEVKTVLLKNEADDGRPILFERHAELPGCYSILGGKIDNIYDIFDKLEAEKLDAESNNEQSVNRVLRIRR